MTLARSLERDWTGEGETSGVGKREMWRGGDEGLAADFDYVMFGKVSFVGEFWLGKAASLGDGEAVLGMLRREGDPGIEGVRERQVEQRFRDRGGSIGIATLSVRRFGSRFGSQNLENAYHWIGRNAESQCRKGAQLLQPTAGRAVSWLHPWRVCGLYTRS